MRKWIIPVSSNTIWRDKLEIGGGDGQGGGGGSGGGGGGVGGCVGGDSGCGAQLTSFKETHKL